MSEHLSTPGQTVGPFFHYGVLYPESSELVPRGHQGAIRLYGRVLDGAGDPVPDALVEIWQTDHTGKIPTTGGSLHRDGWTFTGWGRSATDADGNYGFTTVTPASPSDGRAPFFAMTVFARGLLDALFTRAYLPSEFAAADPLLARLPAGRRETLICSAEPDGFRFDIHLQGPHETVFLTPSA